MRNLIVLLLVSSPFAASICWAQSHAIDIYCGDCRDPIEHPRDYVNFAFNQVYGPDAWLDFDQADDFYIVNSDNQRVYVDVDYVMLGVGIKGLRLPVWPTNLLKITLALPNGDLHSALRSTFHGSLPVPANSGPSNGDRRSDRGGDDDEEYEIRDDDYDWDDVDLSGLEGNTWIEDPDEDGNFDDTDWCEEC